MHHHASEGNDLQQNLMEKSKLGEVDDQWESFVNGAVPILLDGCHVKP